MAKRVMALLGMLALALAGAVPAFAQGTAPGYQYGGEGVSPERMATLSFELAVECELPAGATFFGNVQTGEGGPGIFAELLDSDGDGLYTGVATLPDRFGPGPDPVPPGVEPVSLPVQIVQGTGTRSVPAGTLPGEPTSVVRDFGVVPMEAENIFSASVSFCDGTTPGTPQLPDTGGPLPVAAAIGAMLLAGGLIARKIYR